MLDQDSWDMRLVLSGNEYLVEQLEWVMVADDYDFEEDINSTDHLIWIETDDGLVHEVLFHEMDRETQFYLDARWDECKTEQSNS